jgi:hypothetical protein
MSTLIDCPSCSRKLRVPNEFLGKSVRCPTCGETFAAAEAVAVPPAAAEPTPPPTPEGPAPILDVALKLELDDKSAAPPPPKEERRRAEETPPPRRRRRLERDDEEDERDERRRPRRRRRDFEPCPRCGDDIRRGAVVCPYCGLDLEIQGDGYTRQRPVRMDAEPHRAGLIQALGIASLITAIIYFLFFISLPLGIAAWVMGRRDLRKMDDGEMDPNGRKKTRDGWLCGMIGALLSSVIALIALAIIFAAIMEETQPQRPPPPMPPAFQQGWQPPQQQRPQAPVNNFTLRGSPAAITLKRGETRAVSVIVERLPGFRGNVLVTVEADALADLTVDQAEVNLLAGQSVATFQITADDDAVFGEKVVHVSASSDAGGQVLLDLRVTVVPGR